MPKVGGRRVNMRLFRKKLVVKNKMKMLIYKLSPQHLFLNVEDVHKHAKIYLWIFENVSIPILLWNYKILIN